MPTETQIPIVRIEPRPLRRLRAPSGRPVPQLPATYPGVNPESPGAAPGPQRPSPR